MINNYKQ
jgi:hypothetical protein